MSVSEDRGRTSEGSSRSGGLPSRSRWLAAPVAGLVLAGAAGIGPALAGTRTPPKLPTVSPTSLVQRVLTSPVRHLSGTVTTNADLGLPDLSSSLAGGASAGLSIPSFLTGPTSRQIWIGRPGQLRVATPSGTSERDLVVDGASAWLWNSATQTATHLLLPATSRPAGSATGQAAMAAGMPMPQTVAVSILSHLTPTTRVSVVGTAWVAGQAAYELALAPRAADSLVADVLVAVDAANGLPLEVQVLARNQTSPAFSVGFSSVSFALPSSSNFDFVPPRGATVKTKSLSLASLRGASPARMGAVTGSAAPFGSVAGKTSRGVKVLGRGWSAIVVTAPTAIRSPMLRALLRSSPKLAGGRLVSTSLVNVLVLANGRMLIGAVTPGALAAAASQLAP